MTSEDKAEETAKEVKDTMEKSEVQDDQGEIEKGLEIVMEEAKEKADKVKAVSDADDAEKIVAQLHHVATKKEVAAEIGKLVERMDRFEALIMKAKAQGKAQITKEKTEDNSELKKIYAGTGLFD